jgi:hypothetical protein
MNHAAFALEPDGSEPYDAATYDAIVAPPAAGPADRRFLERTIQYANAAYRNQMNLAPVHQPPAAGAVPNFQSLEFASMTFLPCPLPAGAILPVVAPVAAGAAAAAPAMPQVAQSIAFGV